MSYVCICAVVTEDEVIQAIECGFDTLPKLAHTLGVCCCCKSCEDALLLLIDEYKLP